MKAVASTTIRVNGRDADLARGTVSDGVNAAVALRPQSLAILKLLAVRPGVLVSKDEIMFAVWPNIAVTDDSGAVRDRNPQALGEHAHNQDGPSVVSLRASAQEEQSSAVVGYVCGCSRCCLSNWCRLAVVQPPAIGIGSAPVDRGPAF